MTTVTSAAPPEQFVHLVVGYDGSPPAGRALDAAVRLLQGGTGRIEVVYMAQLSSVAMLSPGAIADELIAAATTLRDAHAGDRGHRGRELVPRHPPDDRFGRRQPGPSLAGAPCYRALNASRKRTSL